MTQRTLILDGRWKSACRVLVTRTSPANAFPFQRSFITSRRFASAPPPAQRTAAPIGPRNNGLSAIDTSGSSKTYENDHSGQSSQENVHILQSLVDDATFAAPTSNANERQTNKDEDSRRSVFEGASIVRPSHERVSVPEQYFEFGSTEQNLSALEEQITTIKEHAELSEVDKTTALYDQLRRDAASGHGEAVDRLVEVLVYERGEQPNMRLYTALMMANVSTEYGSAARLHTLLQELGEEGFSPDTSIYHTALSVLAIHPDCILRAQIVHEMRKRWYNLSDRGWHDMVAGYIKEGQLELALEKLDEMRHAKVHVQAWLLDMFIYTLCDVHELGPALHLIQRRVNAGESGISGACWYYFFDAACKDLHRDAIRYVWHRRVETRLLNPSSGQCIQALNMAARSGDVEIATETFRILSSRAAKFDSQHYEMLLEAYVNFGDIKTALTITCIMEDAEIDVKPRSISALFKYLKESADRPKEVLRMLEEIKEDRVIPTPTYNCLIASCVERDDLPGAIATYKQLHLICSNGPDVGTFNYLLQGCLQQKRKDTAMFLAAEMVALKQVPNRLTYDTLVLICLQEQEYEDAFKYYGEMRNAGFVPRRSTFLKIMYRCAEEGDARCWAILGSMKEAGMDTTNVSTWVNAKWTGGVVPAHETREKRLGAE